MREKFNAAKGLKDFDPASCIDPRIIWDLIRDLPYSQEEWDEYHAAKDSFRNHDEWRAQRSPKHTTMAREYALALREVEENLKRRNL